MMQPTKTGHTFSKPLLAGIIGMTGSCILFAAYLAVPILGIFSGMIAPFPILALRLRFGRYISIPAIIGSAIGLASYFGTTTALLYLVQCGLIATLIPEFLLKGFGAARSITWTTAVNLAAIGLLLGVMTTTDPSFNFHSLATAEINQSVNQAIKLYEQNGVKGEDLDVIKKTMRLAADTVIQIYPAIITITYILLAALNVSLIKRFKTSLCQQEIVIGELKDYRTPEFFVWGFIASGFATLSPFPILTIPAMNLLVLFSTLYFLQGWGVVLTILARQTMSGILRFALYVVLMVQPYLAALIALIGIFDLWGDFRTQKQQENL